MLSLCRPGEAFLRAASQRRQVIMVTHNANLVVLTDADQVVIAASERTTPGDLPNIAYEAGGLDGSSPKRQA